MKKTLIFIFVALLLTLSCAIKIDHLKQQSEKMHNQQCGKNQFYNKDMLSCISCLKIPNSKGTVNGRGCNCNKNYQWDLFTSQCVRCPAQGCSERQEDPDKQKGNQKCGKNQFYNKDMLSCINCSKIPNSKGTVNGRGCNCNKNYQWDLFTSQCVSCSAQGCFKMQEDPDMYKGNQKCGKNQFYNKDLFLCINCSTIPNSKGTVNGRGCNCNKNYQWDLFTSQCVSCPSGEECSGFTGKHHQ